jgi:hypothetical protein
MLPLHDIHLWEFFVDLFEILLPTTRHNTLKYHIMGFRDEIGFKKKDTMDNLKNNSQRMDSEIDYRLIVFVYIFLMKIANTMI